MNVRSKGFTLVELLIVVAIIGILAAIAIPNLMTAIQRAKQKKTMVNMRNIATAWEARATDMSQYNAAGVGIAGISSPIPINDVAAMLQPTYIRSAPLTDAWGRDLTSYINNAVGSGQAANKYALMSAGRDGVLNDGQPMGPFSGFDCDIIYSNGAFLTFPQQ